MNDANEIIGVITLLVVILFPVMVWLIIKFITRRTQ